jgi:hypothetical protein
MITFLPILPCTCLQTKKEPHLFKEKLEGFILHTFHSSSPESQNGVDTLTRKRITFMTWVLVIC